MSDSKTPATAHRMAALALSRMEPPTGTVPLSTVHPACAGTLCAIKTMLAQEGIVKEGE